MRLASTVPVELCPRQPARTGVPMTPAARAAAPPASSPRRLSRCRPPPCGVALIETPLAMRRRSTYPRQAPTPDRSGRPRAARARSEEHTSELQSRFDLVCRLLLEKKKYINEH